MRLPGLYQMKEYEVYILLFHPVLSVGCRVRNFPVPFTIMKSRCPVEEFVDSLCGPISSKLVCRDSESYPKFEISMK